MRIIRKRFIGWDDDVKARLKYATLTDGYLRRYMLVFDQSQTIVIFNQKQIMGWGFILHHGNTFNLNIFVNKRYRNRGVATFIIKESLKYFPIISLAGWNDSSRSLFRKMQKKYPGRIIVFDWLKNMHKYDKILQNALIC